MAAAGERFRLGGDEVTLRVTSAESGGDVRRWRCGTAGGGPPALHTHASAETYRVEHGELAIYRAGPAARPAHRRRPRRRRPHPGRARAHRPQRVGRGGGRLRHVHAGRPDGGLHPRGGGARRRPDGTGAGRGGAPRRGRHPAGCRPRRGDGQGGLRDRLGQLAGARQQREVARTAAPPPGWRAAPSAAGGRGRAPGPRSPRRTSTGAPATRWRRAARRTPTAGACRGPPPSTRTSRRGRRRTAAPGRRPAPATRARPRAPRSPRPARVGTGSDAISEPVELALAGIAAHT